MDPTQPQAAAPVDPLVAALAKSKMAQNRSALLQQQLAGLLGQQEQTQYTQPGGAIGGALAHVLDKFSSGIAHQQMAGAQAQAQQADMGAQQAAAQAFHPVAQVDDQTVGRDAAEGVKGQRAQDIMGMEATPEEAAAAQQRWASETPDGKKAAAMARVKALRGQQEDIGQQLGVAERLKASGSPQLAEYGKGQGEQLEKLRALVTGEEHNRQALAQQRENAELTRRQQQIQHDDAMVNAKVGQSVQWDQHAIERARLAEEARTREAARQEREARERDADVEKLTKLSAVNAPIVEKLAALAPYVNGEKEVPGMSRLDRMAPDVFRQFIVSPEGRNLQGEVKGLVSAMLQKQSGQTVPEQERNNKMQELGMTPGSTVEDWRNGMVRLRRDISHQIKTEESGFRPDVLGLAKKRGAVTSESLPEYHLPGQPAETAPIHATPAPTAPALSPQDQAAVDWARGAGAGTAQSKAILQAHGMKE